MRKVVLVTGGQRSGKSSYAEKLAHQLTDRPVYIATARIWDEEFRQRVMRHRKSRGEESGQTLRKKKSWAAMMWAEEL